MTTPGKLEVTIKINAMPDGVVTDKKGWKEFTLDCDGRAVLVSLRPRMFSKIEEAARSWPLWLAVVTGQMGKAAGSGFVLTEPAVQTFERKPKPSPAATEAASATTAENVAPPPAAPVREGA